MTSPRHYSKITSHDEALQQIKDLYEKKLIDLPLYLATIHTFDEYNHEFVKRRHNKTTQTDAE